MLERFGVLMSDHTNRNFKESMMPKKFRLFAQKGRNVENLSTFSAHQELPSKDMLKWPKRNATMGYGAWKSDAVRHKGFCGSTSLKHVPSPLWCRWRISSEEKQIAKWFKIMPEFRKGHCILPHKRNLYKHAYRDTPTPTPKLCWNLPPRHLES